MVFSVRDSRLTSFLLYFVAIDVFIGFGPLRSVLGQELPPLRIFAPLTSLRFSRFGEDFNTSYNLWMEYLNETSNGKILGRTVELVRADVFDDTKLNSTVAVFTAAMQGKYGRLDYILGPYSTQLAQVALPIIHAGNPDMLVLGAGAADESIFVCDNALLYPCTQPNKRRFPRLWGLNAPGSSYFTSTILLSRLKGASTVAMFYETASFPTILCKSVLDQLKNVDMVAVIYEPIRNLTNVTAQYMIERIRSTGANASFICAYDLMCGLVMQKSEELNYALPLVAMTPCTSNAPYAVLPTFFHTHLRYSIPPSALVQIFAPTNTSSRDTPTSIYTKKFQARTGRAPTLQSTLAMISVITLHTAILAAQSTNPDDVQAILPEIRVDTFAGQVGFNMQGRNILEMISVQNGFVYDPKQDTSYIVAPLGIADRDLVYPALSYGMRNCLNQTKTSPCLHGSCGDSGECVCAEGFYGQRCEMAKEADSSSESSSVTTGIVVGTILGGLLLLSAPIAWKYTENRRRLRKLLNNEKVATELAEAVALMDFESVSYLDEIDEPTRIQTAFKKIVFTLQEAKNYMPQTLFAKDEEPAPADVTDSNASINLNDSALASPKGGAGGGVPGGGLMKGRGAPSAWSAQPATGSSHRTSSKGSSDDGGSPNTRPGSISNPGSFANGGHANISKFNHKEIVQERITCISFQLDTSVLQGTEPAKLLIKGFEEKHTQIVQDIVSAAKEHHGVPTAFFGDTFFVTFNAASRCSAKAYHAGMTLIKTQKRVKDSKTGLHLWAGLSGGYACCGDFGIPGMRFFSTIGTCVHAAHKLRQYHKQQQCENMGSPSKFMSPLVMGGNVKPVGGGSGGVAVAGTQSPSSVSPSSATIQQDDDSTVPCTLGCIDGCLYPECMSDFILKVVDVEAFAEDVTSGGIVVMELLGSPSSPQDGEWMYVLENDGILHEYNEAIMVYLRQQGNSSESLNTFISLYDREGVTTLERNLVKDALRIQTKAQGMFRTGKRYSVYA